MAEVTPDRSPAFRYAEGVKTFRKRSVEQSCPARY